MAEPDMSWLRFMTGLEVVNADDVHTHTFSAVRDPRLNAVEISDLLLTYGQDMTEVEMIIQGPADQVREYCRRMGIDPPAS